MSIQQQSVMRKAFCNMQIKPAQHASHGTIIKAAIHAAESGSGVNHVKEWNAHLRLPTYNKLKREGVMS